MIDYDRMHPVAAAAACFAEFYSLRDQSVRLRLQHSMMSSAVKVVDVITVYDTTTIAHDGVGMDVEGGLFKKVL